MKINADTVIVGTKVILSPYRREHVPKYHEWMLNEELRELTASEPLSLAKEYEMQEKWQLDEDKLTFIILSKQTMDGTPDGIEVGATLLPNDERLRKHQMLGDVNLFFQGSLPPVGTAKSAEEEEFNAEVEIMIAEPSFRRKGMAIEALQLMLGYVTGQPEAFDVDPATLFVPTSKLSIPPQSLIVRISETNLPSIRLFERLGFKVTKRVEVFQELEMRFVS